MTSEAVKLRTVIERRYYLNKIFIKPPKGLEKVHANVSRVLRQQIHYPISVWYDELCWLIELDDKLYHYNVDLFELADYIRKEDVSIINILNVKETFNAPLGWHEKLVGDLINSFYRYAREYKKRGSR